MTQTDAGRHSAPPRERRSPGRRSLGRGLGGRDNALGVIRLVLASAVIFSHAFPLGGWGEDPVLAWSGGQANTGMIAVYGFFAISGYLITKSGANSDVVRYAWHRVLRILPAFWVVLLVGAFVVAPAVWVAGGGAVADYLTTAPGGPVSYLTQNADLSIGQYGVHDVFATTTPYGLLVDGSVLNGSIWTLDYEWTCYLVIGALVLLGVLRRARPLVVLLTAALFAVQAVRLTDPAWIAAHLPFLTDQYTVTLLLIFLCGSCLAVYSERVPLNDGLGVLSLVVAVGSLFTAGFALVGAPAIAYLVLWTAARLPVALRRIGARNDYSYGIYVYGFLVEQLLAHLGVVAWGYLPYALATLLVTVACAWVSWHAIEKPALSWKDRGPGRGVRYWLGRVRSAPVEDAPTGPVAARGPVSHSA